MSGMSFDVDARRDTLSEDVRPLRTALSRAGSMKKHVPYRHRRYLIQRSSSVDAAA